MDHFVRQLKGKNVVIDLNRFISLLWIIMLCHFHFSYTIG